MKYDCHFENGKLICLYCQQPCRDDYPTINNYCNNCNVYYSYSQYNIQKGIEGIDFDLIIKNKLEYYLTIDILHQKTRIYKVHVHHNELVMSFDYIVNITPNNFKDKLQIILTYV